VTDLSQIVNFATKSAPPHKLQPDLNFKNENITIERFEPVVLVALLQRLLPLLIGRLIPITC
jgi:hypothetical protein